MIASGGKHGRMYVGSFPLEAERNRNGPANQKTRNLIHDFSLPMNPIFRSPTAIAGDSRNHKDAPHSRVTTKKNGP